MGGLAEQHVEHAVVVEDHNVQVVLALLLLLKLDELIYDIGGPSAELLLAVQSFENGNEVLELGADVASIVVGSHPRRFFEIVEVERLHFPQK